MALVWSADVTASPGFDQAYHSWWTQSGVWRRLGFEDPGSPPQITAHPHDDGSTRWSGFADPFDAPVPSKARNTSAVTLQAPQVPKEVLGRLKPDTVILAVIDGAMALNNARFRNAAGQSNILYAWTMGAAWQQGQYDLPYGRQVWAHELEAKQRAHSQGGRIDEAACDGALGLLDMQSSDGPRMLGLSSTHGTHVLDLAAGQPQDAQDEQVAVMAVSLPEQITRDTSGTFLQAFAIDAFHAIVDRADALWEACGFEGETPGFPIVVNFSYGVSAGPKDGWMELEREVDRLTHARQTGGLAPLRMVMPAGNDNLAQTQAQISLPRSDAESLSWRLPPGDYSVSYLEIWMPNFLSKEALFGVAPHLRLTLPDGTQIDPPPLAVGQQVNLLSADGGDVVGRLFCDLQDRQDSSDTSSGRVRLLLALNPTAARDPQTPTIPAGAWALDLSLTTKMPDAVHVTLDLCIQRDDTLGIGPDRGVPSYFEAPGYRVFDDAGRVIDTDGERDLSPSAVRRRGTLNALATSVTTCRVGAYRAQDGRMAPYSSSGFGPMHHAAMSQLLVDGPHVSAAGDHSLALGGVMAAGTRSGSVVSLSGTSMASAQIAREVAKALKGWHPTRDPESNLGTPGAIENIAQVAIRERRFSTPALKPDKTGAGRVPFTPLPGYKDRGGL